MGSLTEWGHQRNLTPQELREFIRDNQSEFSPIRYGADPTGTNDSTQAIQDAIDAANAQSAIDGRARVIDLPPGEYIITDTLKLGTVSLRGHSPDVTGVTFDADSVNRSRYPTAIISNIDKSAQVVTTSSGEITLDRNGNYITTSGTPSLAGFSKGDRILITSDGAGTGGQVNDYIVITAAADSTSTELQYFEDGTFPWHIVDAPELPTNCTLTKLIPMIEIGDEVYNSENVRWGVSVVDIGLDTDVGDYLTSAAWDAVLGDHGYVTGLKAGYGGTNLDEAFNPGASYRLGIRNLADAAVCAGWYADIKIWSSNCCSGFVGQNLNRGRSVVWAHYCGDIRLEQIDAGDHIFSWEGGDGRYTRGIAAKQIEGCQIKFNIERLGDAVDAPHMYLMNCHGNHMSLFASMASTTFTTYFATLQSSYGNVVSAYVGGFAGNLDPIRETAGRNNIIRYYTNNASGPAGQWGVIDSVGNVESLTDGATNPAVKNLGVVKTANTSPTTISDFTGIGLFEGLKFYLLIDDANTTLGFASGNINGNGGVNYACDAGDMFTCVYDGTDWWVGGGGF